MLFESKMLIRGYELARTSTAGAVTRRAHVVRSSVNTGNGIAYTECTWFEDASALTGEPACPWLTGRLLRSPEVIPMFVSELAREAAAVRQPLPSRKATTLLSVRQLQILHLLVDGLENKLIAHQIRVSEGTVKNHIRLLLRKLGVRNRTQAVRRARELGIVN